MGKANYADKVKLKESGLPAINSWRDVDANEVKDAINDNDDRITDLEDGGEGSLPIGGTTSQVLAKKSDIDYDVEWKDGGTGGSQNIDEVLKQGNTTEEDLTFDKEGGNNITITDESITVADLGDLQSAEFKSDRIKFNDHGKIKELLYPAPIDAVEIETIASQEWTVLAKINSIGYPELKDIFKTKIDLGATLNLDWDVSPLYYKTLTTTPTAITQTNYKIGMGKMLMLTGAFSYSIQHCDIIVDEGNYDGALWNLFQIFCIDDTVGSEKFTCNHIRTFTI